MAPSSLLSRLYQDLAELHSAPYPGVAIFTDDANVRKFCLVLTPPSGPWKNLALHFDVYLPENWPISPPSVACSVDGIDHPNLFGSYICCDLLKQESDIYRPDGYMGGYTPALTLRGLFLQFLTFFSSSKVEQEYGGYVDIGESVTCYYAREGHNAGNRVVPGSRFSGSTQEVLQEEYESDTRPSVVVRREMSELGPLLHTAKAPRPHTSRVIRIERPNPRWADTYHVIRHWKCKHCPYGSDVVPHCAAPVTASVKKVNKRSVLMIPPAICKLGLLNDDVLYTLASRLPSESVISFSAAYPRLHNLVQSTHVLLQRELRCFFLRTPLSESVLGIGIALDPRSRALSSDFDWLSQSAFAHHGVRKSVEKRDFQFFLPLAFSRPHFKRVYGDIWRRLAEIDQEVQKAENKMSRNPRRRPAGPPKRQETIGVIYRMMNNIVVSLMQSCDDALRAPTNANASSKSKSILHASEKAVVAYCHLSHLLICLVRTDPQILRDATSRLRRFIDQKDSRIKAHVPDLGELIILIMVVVCCPPVTETSPIKWSSLAGPFLEEAITRNVRWVLKDSPHLEVLETGPSDYRLSETFFRSKTSLRLIMFQITFLDLFFKAYANNMSRLDNNYGFPEKELPERMVEQVKEIYKISTWPAFFTRVRFPQGVGFGKERFSDMLRDAVKTSAARRYHNPSSSHQLGVLRGQRSKAEEASCRR
ncbi:hypothetical protein B0H15DRAFT_774428 [Mycena belliarum]|uniref:UBC core domain-containing protein n=1 Tax=Mycena belliarum TaxID=1033014 RepID=A0AAD6U971_9AGAR|nr:hypothetical protein B0H15DRAFT_774428 [Mycena belliae]